MADVRVKFISQKISKLRWRPSENQNLQQSNVFATGNWDDEDGKVCLWRIATPDQDETVDVAGLETITGREPRLLCEAPHRGDVTDLEFLSPENMVTASSTGTVTLYKYHPNSQTIGVLHTWESLHHHPGEVPCPCTCVATQGSDLIVTSGEDGRIHVLNVGHSKPVRVIDKADSCTVNSITFLKQLEVITVNSSGQLKIFDLRKTSDDPSKTFSVTGEQTPLQCVTKHPTQHHIVATGGQDGILYVWDLRHDTFPVTLLEAHAATMWEVMFHPNNPDHLFTCSEDGSVWHWDGSKVNSLVAGTGAGSGGGTGFTPAIPGVGGGGSLSSPWVSMDAGRHKMEITSLLPMSSLSVNTMDVDGQTLLAGTDQESIYTIELPAMR